MKLLHQLGHNYKWPLDSFFENEVGDGFVLLARSIEKEKIGKALSGYKADKYLPHSFLDLQFYGGKDSIGGHLDTYEFHPINHKGKETEVGMIEAVLAGIKFQEELGLKNVLVPNVWMPPEKTELSYGFIKAISSHISKNKKMGVLYFMTIPISGTTIDDSSAVEKLLQELTDMDICFDGYYIVCEPNLEYKKKISIDFKYYANLKKIMSTLKKQGFKTILGFSNLDSIVFSAMVDIDYITIGTYENLRKFSLKGYTEETDGGASKGWYYSEKLLNFVRASQLDLLRERGILDYIRNEDNIFSDVILKDGYPWNTHRPDVHKNYLVSISRQLKTLNDIPLGETRISHIEKMIEQAVTLYESFRKASVYLDDESSNYHLSMWLSVIKTPPSNTPLKK